MLNKAIIMGRLVRDPELRYTQSNTPVSNFTVAVDRRFKTGDGKRETDFINCIAWRSNAEFVKKWFAKGRMICVVGSIQTRQYTDKDGAKRTVTEVVVDETSFCGDSGQRGAGDEAPADADSQYSDLPDEDVGDDDLPF